MPSTVLRAGGRMAVVLALLAWAAALPAPDAAAHGLVLESSPAHQATVPPPKQVSIRFNSRLEKHLCSVTLVGPQKAAILLLKQDTAAAADTLTYSLPDLKPGLYQVKWKVLAADGHVTEGVIAFTVAAPGEK